VSYTKTEVQTARLLKVQQDIVKKYVTLAEKSLEN